MKRMIVRIVLAMILVGKIAFAAESGEPKTWQSDWKEFTKEYPKTEGQESQTKQFMGKDVVWKAKVTKVSPPEEGKKTGTVELAMDPPLRLGTKYSIDSISLKPTQDDWNTWTKVKITQEVVFQTRLTGAFPWANAPVMIFNMNDGRNFATLFTTSGKRVTINPESK